jgi:fructosamine-3-kinase
MRAAFGTPHLEGIMEGYQSVFELADGWRERQQLHLIYPIAVHAVLFKGSFIEQVRGVLKQYGNR